MSGEHNNVEMQLSFEADDPNRNATLSPVLPYDPNIVVYGKLGPFLLPREYTGWIDETMSWKKTCCIHTGLTIMMALFHIKLKGPDAERFLSENSIRDFSTMKVGRAGHTVFCNKFGHLMGHGMVLRLGEDEWDTFISGNIPQYIIDTKKYDIEPVIPEFPFVFQIGGPTSLQTVEHACQKDLHDLKFMHFREATIAGHKVRVLRMGMAGTLAYEVHGNFNEGLNVYKAILAAGQQFGIRRLGEMLFTYLCQHTENGYPQAFVHFYPAYREGEDFYKWYRANIRPEHPGVYDPWDPGNGINDMRGTLGDNIIDYYRNPIELGWGGSIDWNHEFVGKEALKKIAENNPRKPVTLVWNAEDVLDVHASYLREEGEPYLFMPLPRGDDEQGNFQLKVVDKNGKAVGVTSGRTYTLYQRKTISLGILDADCAEFGNEVVILWGDRDKYPVKKIRAKVAKFPSLDLPRNESYDVESIPRFKKK